MSRFLFTLLVAILIAYLWSGLLKKSVYQRRPGKASPADSGRDLVQDPNCLIYFSKDEAIERKRDGVRHFFCSAQCAAAFEEKRAEKGTEA